MYYKSENKMAAKGKLWLADQMVRKTTRQLVDNVNNAAKGDGWQNGWGRRKAKRQKAGAGAGAGGGGGVAAASAGFKCMCLP